jgi:ankyrin repeat protein
MFKKEANQKMLELMNKEDSLSEEEIQLFKKIINDSDLTIQNKGGWTPLMFALDYNQEQNLNLSKKQFDYLIQNSDLKQQNDDGSTPLMFVLRYNKSEKLNFTKEQIDYLIQHSNLKQQNDNGWTPLIFVLLYNQSANLNLTSEQWNYFIQHSDLTHQAKNGWTPLMYILQFKEENSLNIRENQIKKIIISLNKKQQKEIFKNLIIYNSDKITQDDFIKKMNFLLYDCNIFLDKEIINLLNKKAKLSSSNIETCQYIIEAIQKRDLFLKLNKDIKQMNNHQKISTMKI